MNVTGLSVKEVAEMIESRVPGGRLVTSLLLSLLALTTATACAVYLYHALVLPLVSGAFSLFKTRTVAPATVGSVIGSLIGSAILILTFRYVKNQVLQDYSTVLSSQGEVLTSYQKVYAGLGEVLECQKAINLRLDDITVRVSVLEDNR